MLTVDILLAQRYTLEAWTQTEGMRTDLCSDARHACEAPGKTWDAYVLSNEDIKPMDTVAIQVKRK